MSDKNENKRLRLVVRRLTKEILDEQSKLNEGEQVIDLTGQKMLKIEKKLKQAASELNEEISPKLFGKKVRISGKKANGDDVKNVEGIVSGVDFTVTKRLKVRTKITLQEAGYKIINPNEVQILDTLGTNRRSSNYYL